MTNTIRYHLGDIRDVTSSMPDNSVDLIVTSPPFLALRSYLPADHPDKHREIGSEPTPADFLDTLLELSAVWRRLLTSTGSICVELGDTYSGAGGYGTPDSPNPAYGAERFDERWTGRTAKRYKMKDDGWPLAKSLCGIPTLYAWSLAYGHNLLTGQPSPAGQWRIRNLIVWHRPNPPVGALGDKCRPSTSYVTVACTSDRRWFDLDAERTAYAYPHQVRAPLSRFKDAANTDSNRSTLGEFRAVDSAGAPPLDAWIDDTTADLWTIPTQAYAGAHYATFPIALPRKLINLMCPRQVCTVCGEPRRRIVKAERGADPTRPEPYSVALQAQGMRNGWGTRTTGSETTYATLGWSDCGHNNYRPGIVLDPFAGTATTALAAAQLGRDATCIDIDPRNIPLAHHRISDHVQILNETTDGPVTVWTVDRGLPGLKHEADGQLSLFAT